MPEKAKLLARLKAGGFNVPPFIFIPATDFHNQQLAAAETFIREHCHDYKIIVRSAHPLEDYYKGGTFESLEIYSDIGGVIYARNRIINDIQTNATLTIRRQQKFRGAPQIKPEDMGVIIMPFLDGQSIMAKILNNQWEFGYSGSWKSKIHKEPYITQTPHDRCMLELSEEIQSFLGFNCELEYIVTAEGQVFVVQARDISHIETLEQDKNERAVRLDGIRRIRKRHNYRERPIFVMDNKAFFLKVISGCEDLVLDEVGQPEGIQPVLDLIERTEGELYDFALKFERYAVIGLNIQVPEDLYQIAYHYLDDLPEAHTQLTAALRRYIFKVDQFIAEADTLLAKDRYRLNLLSHDAYGVDTVRNPLWNVYWQVIRHEQVANEFVRLSFKTGDMVGIEIDCNEKPIVYRL